jgi:ribonuclease HI
MFRTYRASKMNAVYFTTLHPLSGRLVTCLASPTDSTPHIPIYRHVNFIHRRYSHTSVESALVQMLDPAPQTLSFGRAFSTKVALSKEEALKWEEVHRKDDIMIYTDGSGAHGQVGAAAVMYRNGTLERYLQFHLSSKGEYTSHEAELVGILLGVHLLNTAGSSTLEAKINSDSSSAVIALLRNKKKTAQYIVNQILEAINGIREYEANNPVASPREPPSLTFVWIPGHQDIPGNQEADIKAKEAARGYSSDPKDLPCHLTSPNWREEFTSRALINGIGSL